METVMRKIKDIKPYERNTKKHDKTQIDNVAESIRKYGFVQPIVIDRDGVIVIGHCRFAAAKKLKMKEVPCVSVDDLTPEQVNALRIVDNKTNESEWDLNFLIQELEDVDLSEFDFDFDLNKVEEVDPEKELELQEKELEPYKYIHYLVTIDTNDHDIFIDKIKELEAMGADVKMTRNNT